MARTCATARNAEPAWPAARPHHDLADPPDPVQPISAVWRPGHDRGRPALCEPPRSPSRRRTALFEYARHGCVRHPHAKRRMSPAQHCGDGAPGSSEACRAGHRATCGQHSRGDDTHDVPHRRPPATDFRHHPRCRPRSPHGPGTGSTNQRKDLCMGCHLHDLIDSMRQSVDPHALRRGDPRGHAPACPRAPRHRPGRAGTPGWSARPQHRPDWRTPWHPFALAGSRGWSAITPTRPSLRAARRGYAIQQRRGCPNATWSINLTSKRRNDHSPVI